MAVDAELPRRFTGIADAQNVSSAIRRHDVPASLINHLVSS
jgi:hypothetical protein